MLTLVLTDLPIHVVQVKTICIPKVLEKNHWPVSSARSIRSTTSEWHLLEKLRSLSLLIVQYFFNSLHSYKFLLPASALINGYWT